MCRLCWNRLQCNITTKIICFLNDLESLDWGLLRICLFCYNERYQEGVILLLLSKILCGMFIIT